MTWAEEECRVPMWCLARNKELERERFGLMHPNLIDRVLREYSRRELPAWGRLLSAFRVSGARFDDRWQGAPTLTIRGKLHDYLMEVDLSNWSDRHAYFLERYYDLATQRLLMAVLRPGDRAVDIGANNGMLSLVMARMVGPAGLVEAIEPNPVCAARIRRAVELNKLAQVRLHVCALGDAEGEATLRQTSAHTGTATLGPLSESERQRIHQEFTVRVATGDALLISDTRPVALIKVDVEGYECAALRGLKQTMQRDLPVIITEVDARWLARCRNKPADVEALLREISYAPFAFNTPRVGLHRKLAIQRLESLAADSNRDVLWLHERSKSGRLLTALVPAA